ncbi:hypothetical protein BC332_24580 [Capsicum chinense]|nr:hypothetical protein BC332_24580 [Capsicum chinense]
MVKTPEKKESVKAALSLLKLSRNLHVEDVQAASRAYESTDDGEDETTDKKTKSASSKRRIQYAERSEISRKSGKNRSGSSKMQRVLVDKDERGEILESASTKRRNSKTPRTEFTESSEISRKSGFGHGKNHSGTLEKHPFLDEEDEEEEKGSKKMRSVSLKRRILDGKKLPKPKFGYSMDGKKLSRYPQIEKILDIIGKCSDPFEKKLSKTDLDIDQDKISFHKDDFKSAILPLLKKDEIDNLAKGVKVKTYDEFGSCYEMRLNTYRNAFYKLCNGWEKLLNEHKFKENEDCYVAVWAFRHVETDKLCFALILKK